MGPTPSSRNLRYFSGHFLETHGSDTKAREILDISLDIFRNTWIRHQAREILDISLDIFRNTWIRHQAREILDISVLSSMRASVKS